MAGRNLHHQLFKEFQSMIETKVKLIHSEENGETNLMPVTITLFEDVLIVRAENGAVVSMGLDAENLTLLAWANDNGKHDPDLIIPVKVVPNMEFNYSRSSNYDKNQSRTCRLPKECS